jgi:membrane associated rhomboid family serine protease
MKDRNEKPIPGYDFSLSKEKIKEIFNTPEKIEYSEKKKKTQKRRENVYKFTSIGLSTNSVRNLIIANVIFFIASYFINMNSLALFNITDQHFAIWQPITSMFLHGGVLHILLNMFVLWQFGNQIEQVIGTNKFLTLYFLSGITSSLLWMFLGTGPAVGASGALCGLLAAYIFIAPETEVLFLFIIPMKMKNFIYGFGALSLIFGLLSLINPSYGFGIGHFAHLGGLIGGYLLTYYWTKNKLIQTF